MPDSIELAHFYAELFPDIDFECSTMGPFLCYEPVSCCADLVPAPTKMMGKFCITCMVGHVDAVVVIRLDFTCRTTCGAASRTLARHFAGRNLRRCPYNKLLRLVGICTASGKRFLVMLLLIRPPDVMFNCRAGFTFVNSGIPINGVHVQWCVPTTIEEIEMFSISLHRHLHE